MRAYACCCNDTAARVNWLMNRKLWLSVLPLCLVSPPAAAVRAPVELERFARDYERDPAFTAPFEFGVRIDEGWWTVRGLPNHHVEVVHGKPTARTFSFELSSQTLRQLDEGSINPLTAAGKHSGADKAPLETGNLNGFTDDTPEVRAQVLRALFSFWTRGLPERVQISLERARVLHGAPGVLLYYAPGFRSVWHVIRPGERIDNHHGQGTGQPWDSLIVVIKAGGGKAKIAGKEVKLADKEAVFVPARAPMDLWTDSGEALEIVLLMFGGKA